MIGEKEGDGTVEDISGMTKEELDKISKKTALGKNEQVVLSSNDWVEENRIRYLKRPIKVHYIPWDHYTLDCTSITSGIYDSKFLYVFAFSTSENSKKLLSKVFRENSLGKKRVLLLLWFAKGGFKCY